MPLTAERLREVLRYEPDTGAFRWRTKASKKTMIGDVAGSVHYRGYVNIRIDGCRYGAHRLAFLWMTGRMPVEQVDHRDGNTSNNAWENLREASHAQNCANSKTRPSRSGMKGVIMGPWGKWHARIHANGKQTYLGSFATKELAHAAYCAAAVKHFGEFARF